MKLQHLAKVASTRYRNYLLEGLVGLMGPNTPFINALISTERSCVILSWYILLPISMICSSTSSSVWSTLSCSCPFLITVTLKPFPLASRKASCRGFRQLRGITGLHLWIHFILEQENNQKNFLFTENCEKTEKKSLPWAVLRQQRHGHFQAYPYELVWYSKDSCNRQGLQKQSHDTALVPIQGLQPSPMNKTLLYVPHFQLCIVQCTVRMGRR